MSDEQQAADAAESIASKSAKPRRMAREPKAESIAPTGGADASAPAPRTNKQSLVLDLLARPAGATLAEMMEATGWLAHSTRAALTGLRKKGHTIEGGSREGITFYRLAAK